MAVGVSLRMLFGEVDADLHRPAGVHRVQPVQQGLAQRHTGNDLVVQLAQLLLAAHRLQTLLVALAVARRGFQSAVDQQPGNMQACGTAVDFLTGDTPQVGYLRIGSEGRFLFGHREYRTQIAFAWRYTLGFECHLNVPGPALAILGLGRQQPQQLGTDLGRISFWDFFTAPGTALQQCQGHQPGSQ
ncbi:hypothetical protein D3C76_784290 [compost metagenome]